MDIFERIKTQPGPIGQFASYAEGEYVFPQLEGDIGPRMIFKGKEVITWSINNYLGLANHPEVRKADAEGAERYGMAYPMGARAMSGQTELHAELERQLAEFVQKESAYLLNFGYQGMVSCIDALSGRNDVIVYDSQSHACIIDGVRLHMGKRFTYQHNDMEALDKNLQRATRIVAKTGGGILVISEGVFGMSGAQGKLKEILEFKNKYKFRLLVDDAHGFGTLGKTGAGTGEEQGVQDKIDLYFATFAKSMAGIGAFFAADKEIIQYLKYNLRSQIFAKSLPMPMVFGALKRLELLRNNTELKDKLWYNTNRIQEGLREKGFNIGLTNTCVTPVYLQGTPLEAALLAQDLRTKYDVFVSMVVYPVIPKGQMIYRIIPTAEHTDEEIDITLDAFEQVRDKLVAGVYAKEAESTNMEFIKY